MKTHPILFSAPMIRALLDGRKTQTRRVFKLPSGCIWDEELGGEANGQVCSADGKAWCDIEELRSPYGRPGDLLWVRETCRGISTPPHACRMWTYDADNTLVTGPVAWTNDKKAIPSIHMPRWASRLTLRLTDVRVERLQDISEADAILEGATSRPRCYGFRHMHDGWSMDWSRVGQRSKYASGETLTASDICLASARSAFANIFESINAANGNGWYTNPWVWVLTFEVIKQNVNAALEQAAK